MKIKKYLNPSSNLPRRRLIKFTPEQERQFNLVTIPGTNVNSNVTVGETARKTGVQALNFLAQEAARKDAEIESRSDRKTVKRLTTVGERLRGDNGYSSRMSGGTGMSGRDPLLGTIFDWTVGAKGLETLGKTALWNFAKYGPSNLFRGLARNYFINNAFKLELRQPILFGFGTELTPNNLFRTKVYKGGEIADPYSNFVTTDPRYAANYGKVTPYLFESKSIARTTEPMMGYKDPVNMDMFVYNNTKHNPGTTAIMGHDAVTGEFTPSRGIEILNLNPKNLYPIETSKPSTSLKFFERKPAKNNIVGTSLDYSVKDSKGIDFIKQFFALLKINGKEYTLEGLKDSKNVQQGLPEYIQSYLSLNTVERAVRAMRKNGYSEREILLYVNKVNEEMNKVKVGMYSDLEYNAAGALDFGGFYNSDTNFISINKDALLINPAFTPNRIMKHEGRHLIDYNTSMTDDVINILEKAYDKDFLEIPKHENAGNLKYYLHMDRERVTTNRDAREVLLSNLEKHPGEFLNLTKFAQTSFGKYKDMVDFLNELILYADPEDIINAVENSNGYGKRYINYLKKNNKLTSTKIEQLRLAMIHVPSYLLPVAGGYTLSKKSGGKITINNTDI